MTLFTISFEDERINFLQTSTLDFINNKLIKKSLWEKVPYCERRFIEDTFPYHQLIYHANKIVSNEHDESNYYYTNRSTSLIHSASKEKHGLFMNLCWLDIYDFLMIKILISNPFIISLCYVIRWGIFFDPRKNDIEKIKQEYPEEFNELYVRWGQINVALK